jgi:septal ring-binding cell division protein DamX
MLHPMNEVNMRNLLGIALLGLAVTLGTAAWGQETTSTTNSDTSVKHDLKTAGRATKNATKKTGHKVKHTSKRVVHKGARKTRHTSTKVEHKTTTGTEPQ